MKSHIALIGSPSGWGAPVQGSEKGPSVLRKAGLVEFLQEGGVHCRWDEMVRPKVTSEEVERLVTVDEAQVLVQEHSEQLCETVERVMDRGEFPWVIGGDHSIAVGTWSGVIAHLEAAQHFGLIWIDAHLDGHVPETSPSMAYHGMSLACLLGYGDPFLCSVGGDAAKLSPKHVTIIGARSYEDEEHTLLKNLGVRIVPMEEVAKRGFKVVLEEALICANTGTMGFGISLDIDFFDPAFASSTGTPVEGGPKPEEVIPHLAIAAEHPNFKAFELVEFNPELGDSERTRALIFDICAVMAHCNEKVATHV